jgi:hypothetical protein
MANPAHVIATPAQRTVPGIRPATRRAKDIAKDTPPAKKRKLPPIDLDRDNVLMNAGMRNSAKSRDVRRWRQKYHTARRPRTQRECFSIIITDLRNISHWQFLPLWLPGLESPVFRAWQWQKTTTG